MSDIEGLNRINYCYQLLRGRIVGGKFSAGSRLKPAALAAEIGVSGPVVREALTRLAGEGLVTVRPNRGFSVFSPTVEEVKALTEARVEVDTLMLRLAERRHDLEWKSKVVAAIYQLRETPMKDPDSGDVSEDWRLAHTEFHRVLVSGCGNPVLMDIRTRLAANADLVVLWSVHVMNQGDRLQEHEDLARLVLAHETDEATALLSRHYWDTTHSLIDAGILDGSAKSA